MQINLTNKLPLLMENFFSFNKADGLFFPFFRIAISFFCLVHLFSILPDFELLYTNNGLIPLDVLSILKTDYMPSYNYIQNTLSDHGISATVLASTYVIIYCVSCVMVFIGLFTRFFSFLLLFLHLLIFQSSSPYMYGLDFFKSIALFYCFIFPVGNKMSIDQLLFKKIEINPSPYRRLLKIHMSIVYVSSGFDKAFGINWWNGESIWKAIHLPGFTSNLIDNYNILSHYPILPIAFGICTLIIEILYPLAMFIKKTKVLWLILIISLHVGIIVCLNLYFFGLFMILLNLSAFLTLEESTKNDRFVIS